MSAPGCWVDAEGPRAVSAAGAEASAGWGTTATAAPAASTAPGAAAAPVAPATAAAAPAAPSAAAAAIAAAAAARGAGPRLRRRGSALSPGVAAGGLQGVRGSRGWDGAAPVAGSCHQACQPSELLTLAPHLTLEGGEPTGGVGVNRLDAPAGLLQVAAQGTGLLLDVKPEAEARRALGLELGPSLRDEVSEGRLRATLQGLHRRLEPDDATGHHIQPIAQGADLLLPALRRRVRDGRCGRCGGSRCEARRAAWDATGDAGTSCRSG